MVPSRLVRIYPGSPSARVGLGHTGFAADIIYRGGGVAFGTDDVQRCVQQPGLGLALRRGLLDRGFVLLLICHNFPLSAYQLNGMVPTSRYAVKSPLTEFAGRMGCIRQNTRRIEEQDDEDEHLCGQAADRTPL